MKKEATIIAVVNQKGGTAKTTTVENLGIGLSKQGKKVLLIDADPQASLTISLGYPQPDDLELTLSDLLNGTISENPVALDEVLIHQQEGIDLIPSNISLAGLEVSGRHPRGNIIAYQIRQSFKPGEITPEEANQVGYETAMRFTKGNHAFIVATHTDKAHIHNHIIFNSTRLDCTHKFRDFFFVGLALQRLSDIICLEHGLSVIEKKKPSERVKRTTYPEKKSFRDNIRDAINQILKEGSAKDFDELLYKLEDAGYEIKRGKHISLKGKEQKRFIRLRSLGGGYTDEDLKKILAGEMEHAFEDNEKAEK